MSKQKELQVNQKVAVTLWYSTVCSSCSNLVYAHTCFSCMSMSACNPLSSSQVAVKCDMSLVPHQTGFSIDTFFKQYFNLLWFDMDLSSTKRDGATHLTDFWWKVQQLAISLCRANKQHTRTLKYVTLWHNLQRFYQGLWLGCSYAACL